MKELMGPVVQITLLLHYWGQYSHQGCLFCEALFLYSKPILSQFFKWFFNLKILICYTNSSGFSRLHHQSFRFCLDHHVHSSNRKNIHTFNVINATLSFSSESSSVPEIQKYQPLDFGPAGGKMLFSANTPSPAILYPPHLPKFSHSQFTSAPNIKKQQKLIKICHLPLHL